VLAVRYKIAYFPLEAVSQNMFNWKCFEIQRLCFMIELFLCYW
jgi:hypothetical protein